MKRAIFLVTLVVPLYCFGQTALKGKLNSSGGAGLVGKPQDFSISVSPSTLSVSAGGNATATVTVQSLYQFSSAVNLAASGGPPGATFSFSPSSVTPTAGGSATSTLTISTAANAPGSACPGSGSFAVQGSSGSLVRQTAACVAITALSESLTVNLSTGGSVSASPGSLFCSGLTCTGSFGFGTVVTLTETPNAGNTFTAWGGACASFGTGSTCTLTMTSNLTASATWSGQLTTYNARTDMAMLGTGIPGELLPTCGGAGGNCPSAGGCSSQSTSPGTGCNGSCTAKQQCLNNAYNSSAATGRQGAALSFTGNQTQAPPAPGTSPSVCTTNPLNCPPNGPYNINGLADYPTGINTPITDPDFGALFVRATGWELNNSTSYPCLGGKSWGSLFSMGSSGNTLAWAPDETRVLIFPVDKPPSMLAFDPVAGVGTATGICGGYLPGASAFSSVNPHRLYTTTTDQENTVLISSMTGTFLTGEAVTNSLRRATLQAINPLEGFAQFSTVGGSGSYVGTVWTGAVSGATMTLTANPPTGSSTVPYTNAIYKGVLCDGTLTDPDEAAVCGTRNPWYGTTNACANAGNSTNPACWYVQWELLFEYNYLPVMAGNAHFPSSQNSCLPQNYNASYTGVFGTDELDQSFTIVYSDNGQANHTGYNQVPPGGTCSSNGNGCCKGLMGAGAAGTSGYHVCTGPVYNANYTVGHGCRLMNSMTDVAVGDDLGLSQGQLLNAQANVIALASVNNTPVVGDIFIQTTTGAETQLMALEDVNGQVTNGSWPGFAGWTQALTGLIYQNGSTPPNGTDKWYDCGPAPTTLAACSATVYFTPSAVPTNPPYFYPDVMHDGDQSPNQLVTRFSLVQQPNMQVTGTGSVCHQGTGNDCSSHVQSGFTIANGQTVISYQNNASYSPGQQFVFFGLAGTDDQYLNCLLPATIYCPVWTAVGGGNGSGSGGSIIITDTIGASAGYSDTETYNSSTKLPQMSPNGQLVGANGLTAENYWQIRSLANNVSLEYGGHSAIGDICYYQGKSYACVNMFNPSQFATSDGTPSGAVYGPAASLADAQTPPAGSNYPKLLPLALTPQQHGSYGDPSGTDYAPPVLFTTSNCGQALSGAGASLCNTSWQSLYEDEIIAMENWITRSSPGSLVGADANYGTGYSNAVYRCCHEFNTSSSWNFNAQNAIGNCGPLGDWCIFPSDWWMTLGCMDGSDNCWSSWQASAPNASQSSSATVEPPTSFTQSGTGTAWSNPSNLAATGTLNFATVTVSGGGNYSQQLQGTALGFSLTSLPATVLVTFQYYGVISGSLGSVIDVQMLKGGVAFGNAKLVSVTVAQGGAVQQAQLTFSTSGLVLSDLNNSGFGFQFKAVGVNGGAITFGVNDLRVSAGGLTWSAVSGSGQIVSIAIDPAHPGQGCVPGDLLTVLQGGASAGTFTISSVGSRGQAQAISLASEGGSYTTANDLATSGGSCVATPEVNITAAPSSTSIVTVNMSNSFCPTSGLQSWPAGGSINCGSRAGTVALSGFSESWLSGTLALSANPSGANPWACSSGTCSSFVLVGVPNACTGIGSGSPPCSGTETTGTQTATPTACATGVPCQRADLFFVKISSAHQ